MVRPYQYNFSSNPAGRYDVSGRQQKAKTMVAVLEDFMQRSLHELSLLDIGSSSGIVDEYLADYFKSLVGIDIDEPAIKRAKEHSQKSNLVFQLGDAMHLQFEDNTFDIVICSQVYEHTACPESMLDEIFRVLVPGGICYFAASNRLMFNEPHHNLPLLSVMPRPIAHLYIKLAKKGNYYHELHYTYWGLKKLVQRFQVHDYTEIIITNPHKYHVGYMIKPASIKAGIAKFILSKFPWLSPGYIWLLQKP